MLFGPREIGPDKWLLEIVLVTDASRRQHGDHPTAPEPPLNWGDHRRKRVALTSPALALDVLERKILHADAGRALHRNDVGLRRRVVSQAKHILTPIVASRCERHGSIGGGREGDGAHAPPGGSLATVRTPELARTHHEDGYVPISRQFAERIVRVSHMRRDRDGENGTEYDVSCGVACEHRSSISLQIPTP